MYNDLDVDIALRFREYRYHGITSNKKNREAWQKRQSRRFCQASLNKFLFQECYKTLLKESYIWLIWIFDDILNPYDIKKKCLKDYNNLNIWWYIKPPKNINYIEEI